MPTEAGKKIYECIKAVCRMHASASKLLKDFDKYATYPSISVFQNTATKDRTNAASASYWMPEGVFRYLSCKDNPRLVEAITVCFLDNELEEPVLLLGQLEYTKDPLQTRGVCDGWDLWYMYFPVRTGWIHGAADKCVVPEDRALRIQSATLISVPLYSIERAEDISTLLKKVRANMPAVPGNVE